AHTPDRAVSFFAEEEAAMFGGRAVRGQGEIDRDTDRAKNRMNSAAIFHSRFRSLPIERSRGSARVTENCSSRRVACERVILQPTRLPLQKFPTSDQAPSAQSHQRGCALRLQPMPRLFCDR